MFDDATFLNIVSTNNFPTHRKPIIQKLQKILKAKVIVYTASPSHPLPIIMAQDILPFEDLLRSCADSTEGYLIINSPGGDGNVAEKMIMMCRERFTKSFKVIVPNFAKSAATMIALGSDEILMGYLAELGPIDPQIGVPILGMTPARSFIDGLEMIRRNVKEKNDPVQMYYPLLSNIRPEIIAQCHSAIDGSRQFAERWLTQYMLKNNPQQAKDVACALSEGVEYKSHGKVIDYDEAKNKLKLNATKIPPDSELWANIWELYCRSALFLQQKPNGAKLFESETVSLTMDLTLSLPNAPPSRAVPIGPSPNKPIQIPLIPQKPSPNPLPMGKESKENPQDSQPCK